MTVLDKKLSHIERGAYWFGILGRLSIFWGCLSLVTAIFLLAAGAWHDPNSEMYTHMVSGLTGAFMPLVSGWLFLLGRDAFEAISGLIQELQDVV